MNSSQRGHRMTRRGLLRTTAGTAAFMALSACAPGTSPAGSATPGTTSAATAAPIRGGIVTVDVSPDRLSQLDLIRFTYEERVANLVTERLIVRDYDMTLKPNLATEWKLEGDAWTMKLRPGVSFTDGTPWDAEALQANFARWSNPQGTHSARGNLTSWGATLEIVDKYTVRIRMKTGHAVLPAALGGHGWLVMSPKALEALKTDPNALNTKPVGTGPFKMESMTPGEILTLARNDSYWDGAPYLDKVVIRSIAEAGARTGALLTGDVDVSINLPAEQVTALKSQSTVRIEELRSISQVFIKINTKSAALSNPLARQAVSIGVNRDQWRDLAYGGLLEPFDGPVNPLVFKSTHEGTHKFDVAKAKQLIEQAGPAAKEMEFLYAPSPQLARLGQLMQQQFAAIGVNLKVTQAESAVVSQRRADGKFDLAATAHSNSYGDAALFLNTEVRGSADQGKWATDQSNALIDRAMAESDTTKRAVILNEFWQLFYKDPAHISIGGGKIAFGIRDRVVGFRPHPNLYLTSLAKASIKG